MYDESLLLFTVTNFATGCLFKTDLKSDLGYEAGENVTLMYVFLLFKHPGCVHAHV